MIGILRGDHEEGFGQGARFAFAGDLMLLHCLKQCALRFRRGAVDLVDQDYLGEDGSRMELEAASIAVVYGNPDDVRRQHVGRALDAVKVQTEQPGQDVGQDGFTDARQVLYEEVAACEQTDKGEANLAILAQNNAAGMMNRFMYRGGGHG